MLFRSNTEEIIELAGCDRLTISPGLMSELAESEKLIVKKLSPATQFSERPSIMTETDFRWQMNEDAMATEKTAEGIRNFAKDQDKLEAILLKML